MQTCATGVIHLPFAFFITWAPCPKTWVSPLTFCEDSGISTEDFVAQLGRAGELSIVSRLDYPTSGLLPLAVGVESPADHWLRAQFAGRLVWKEYVCLCQGPTLGEVGTQGVDLFHLGRLAIGHVMGMAFLKDSQTQMLLASSCDPERQDLNTSSECADR